MIPRPNAADFVDGVLNLRDKIALVVALCRRFGRDPTPFENAKPDPSRRWQARIIVVEIKGTGSSTPSIAPDSGPRNPARGARPRRGRQRLYVHRAAADDCF